MNWYATCEGTNVTIVRNDINDLGINLTKVLKDVHKKHSHYCISNPDIQPFPSVPENFLEIFKYFINKLRFHRAGFALDVDTIPDSLYGDNVRKWEKKYNGDNYSFKYNGELITGTKAPLDLTFAMYKSSDGWDVDIVNTPNWWNSIRLFKAFHFGWYIPENTKIKEHINYFNTCRHYTDKVLPSKGVNNWNSNKKLHGQA